MFFVKKLLFLGGAYSQIPAIIKAKELGCFVITCDYLPDNPGHKYANKYLNISTTDIEAVYEAAKSEKINGIIAYASDPSAQTAAYIAQKLKLPCTSSYNSVKVLSEKHLFRALQKKLGMCTPDFITVGQNDDIKNLPDSMKFPLIVKPVDSSGSKGISIANQIDELKRTVEHAIAFSRSKTAIVESFIKSKLCQLHGDGIVYNGELKYLELGDQRFKDNVPIGTSLPSHADSKNIGRIKDDVRKMLSESGFKYGGINVEARIDTYGIPYIIEIGPRSGGNYIPQLMEAATGYPVMENALRMSVGEPLADKEIYKRKFCFQYIIGSDMAGVFKELYFDDYIDKKVIYRWIHKKYGDYVDTYQNSSGVVGVAIIAFNDFDEMERDILNIKTHIRIILEDEA